MADDRDPRLLQLFAAKQRPLEVDSFVAELVVKIEREERQRARLRYAVITVVLVAAAFSTMWLMNGLARLARSLPADMQTGLPASIEPQALTASAFTLIAAAIAFAWLLVRGAR
jgi:hypothetical protein